jgi:hypothetical protein
LTALVWIINGLYCKLLNLVPRHQEIVARILGNNHSKELIIIIGVLELLMAIWILSNIKAGLNTLAQIAIVAFMNFIEFFVTPDLLLFGRLNILVAFSYMSILYYKEFIIKKSFATA